MSESTIIKVLAKHGYKLSKRGDGYMIIDLYKNYVVAGSESGTEYELSIEQVIEWIKELTK